MFVYSSGLLSSVECDSKELWRKCQGL